MLCVIFLKYQFRVNYPFSVLSLILYDLQCFLSGFENNLCRQKIFLLTIIQSELVLRSSSAQNYVLPEKG